MVAEQTTAAIKPRWWWLLAFLAGGAALALAIHWNVPAHLRELLQVGLNWIEQLGFWAPILFISLYTLATVLFVPGTILTLGAGAVFGIVKGSIYVSIGATLGATAAFLVGRYLARAWIARKIEGNPRFKDIDQAVADQGWKIVGLTRLSPVFPFTLLNYAFGLTQVRLSHYFLASWIGMLPGTVMYVYIGSLLHTGASGTTSTLEWFLRGVGLLATILVTVILTRIARRALRRSTGASPAPPPPD